MMQIVCDLGELPFYVGATDASHHHGLPDTLPFRIGLDNGRVVQAPHTAASHALAAAYARGSRIGTPLAAEGIGRRYADDFVAFLHGGDLANRRVLEIGCGDGYLLQHLARHAGTCAGIDPGVADDTPHTIRDTFPSPRITGAFDLILHYCVLEHVEDADTFVRAQVALLAPGGRLVVAVPNVEADLRDGDVSVFVHQHWSYFTRRSLRRLLAAAGLIVTREALSGYGGLIYVEAVPGTPSRLAEPEDHGQLAGHIAEHIAHGRALFEGAGTFGVFPACRAMNLLQLLHLTPTPRLFDDDPRLHGTYLPPLDRAIESRADLLARPVDTLVITSRSFGPALRLQLAAEPSLAAMCLRDSTTGQW